MRTYSIIHLALILTLIAGEIQCVYKAIKSDWKAPYKREVIYTASALTGLGCFVGWINIEENNK